MQQILTGRVALITGAASGIGRAIALRLAREGALVSVVDVDPGGAEDVVREIREMKGEALAIQCDVCNEEQVNRAIEETEKKLGRIGILVNNAGIAGATFLADMSTEEWLRMFGVHCNGMFFFSRAAAKSMKEGDRIISISSVDGLRGRILGTHYSAAKGAINAFTATLALEVAHRGITVNAIAPGQIGGTAIGNMMMEVAPDFRKEIPVLRCGEPEDIAELAAFLASPKTGYITGQTIVVDGGASLAHPMNQFLLRLMRQPEP
ncbi:MAG: SDR family oxidoreductase [Dehalococcoidia bacterium]|nr:SDR family oxidoreductase [Dehalococcoidia bacterium]